MHETYIKIKPGTFDSVVPEAGAVAPGNRPKRSNSRRLHASSGVERYPGIISEVDFLAVIMNIDNLIPSQQQDAANLFRTYGSLAGVMTTPELELAANPDIGNRCAANIAAARKLIVQGAYAPLANVPVITSYDTLFQYLQWSTDRDGIERLRLLCMGPPGNLISDMEIVIGTHNNVHVEPSEIVTRALAVRATSIIIVHNHPSGVAQPSKNDIDCTCELKAACDLVRIRLDDHVIVAAGTMYSFRQNKRL